MVLSFRQLILNAIFSFCLSMDDVNPTKGVSVTLFSPVSVPVEVWSTSIVGVSSSCFPLVKRWFSFSPCFPFGLKKVADWLRLVSPVDII